MTHNQQRIEKKRESFGVCYTTEALNNSQWENSIIWQNLQWANEKTISKDLIYWTNHMTETRVTANEKQLQRPDLHLNQS